MNRYERIAKKMVEATSRNEILKAITQYRETLMALEQLEQQYAKYWSFGVSSDPILEDMMKYSSDLAHFARPKIWELKEKMAEWRHAADKMEK